MALTYGFYNSLNHDRLYDAVQVSEMFDGLILDGVFSTIGNALVVKESEIDNTVIVQPGKAWFNHTWTKNDADLPITAEESTLVLDRIDAVVLDINSAMNVRENSIIFVKGDPSEDPQKPALINDDEHHQYPLAYVKRTHEVEHIRQADITNCVGTDECPFVLSVLKTISIDELLPQWRDELDKFIEDEEAEFNDWSDLQKESFETWSTVNKEAFIDWFNNLKVQLSGDVAGKLQVEVENATSHRYVINDILANKWTENEDGSYSQTFTINEVTKNTEFGTGIYCLVDKTMSNEDSQELSAALGYINRIRTDDLSVTLICTSNVPDIDIHKLVLTEVK